MRLKRLERAWKALFIRAAAALLGRPRRISGIDWSARPHRVLYLRHDRIGDMILATGLIRAIATSRPTVALDVLASPANAPVLRYSPFVNAVVVFDVRRPWRTLQAVRELRRARYDAVLDCMVLSPSMTTLVLMLLSGARHRIGVGGRSNDFAYTLPVAPVPWARHHVEHSAALAVPFGVDPAATDWHPTITLTPPERERAEALWREAPASGGAFHAGGARRMLVNVSAGKAFRRWPDERFVAALRHVRARDPALDVLVIGSPTETDRVEAIAREGGARAVRTPGIRDALALVATADLVFSPDTSIAHAASAFRRPAVVMYIRGMGTLYALYRTPGHSLVSPEKTLAALPLHTVLAALDDLLALPGPAAAAEPGAGPVRRDPPAA